MLDNDYIKYMLSKLLNPVRDASKSNVGPSTISDPCDYCLGMALLRIPKRQGKYWLGSKIGDAVHNLLENSVNELGEEVESVLRPLIHPDTSTEKKYVIHNLEGYGEIRGKIDLSIPSENQVVDYKTSTKLKIKNYKLYGVPTNYQYQMHLYGYALENMGHDIKYLSLVFIARDGTSENDIWVHTFDYDRAEAEKCLRRVEGIWEHLKDNELETLNSDNECYYCTREIGRI